MQGLRFRDLGVGQGGPSSCLKGKVPKIQASKHALLLFCQDPYCSDGAVHSCVMDKGKDFWGALGDDFVLGRAAASRGFARCAMDY